MSIRWGPEAAAVAVVAVLMAVAELSAFCVNSGGKIDRLMLLLLLPPPVDVDGVNRVEDASGSTGGHKTAMIFACMIWLLCFQDAVDRQCSFQTLCAAIQLSSNHIWPPVF